MQVRIYHNEARGSFMADADEVSQLGELHLAFEFEMDDLAEPTDRVEINKTLEGIYHQLNIDIPTAEYAVAYREDRNRSLSVGDVVKLGDEVAFPFAVERMGFEAIANAALAVGLRRGEKAGVQ